MLDAVFDDDDVDFCFFAENINAVDDYGGIDACLRDRDMCGARVVCGRAFDMADDACFAFYFRSNVLERFGKKRRGKVCALKLKRARSDQSSFMIRQPAKGKRASKMDCHGIGFGVVMFFVAA